MVPESIYTPPTEGHWKFLGEGRGLKSQKKEKYEAKKLEFPGVRESAKQKTLHGGSMEYFLELLSVLF